jgi:iron(III) transport system ATP-binding protein
MSLVLRNITRRFGDVVAVANASLEAPAGEIVCLFGPSGCGKTTLLRIAAGLERAHEGEVLLNGAALAGRGLFTPPEKRPIGVVFQDYVLFPHLTVKENIRFGADKTMKGVRGRIAALLDAFGLADLSGRYPHELSGGQQQRVALARALIREPQALLLDEPFASIDLTTRSRLREDLRITLKEQQAAVILVTHDPDEALALGDKVALMRHGKIMEAAAPKDLYTNPQTPDGARIFRGSQMLEGEIRDGKIVTPLGVFAAAGLAAGPGVVIVREGAAAAIAKEEGAGVVADARFLGPGWALFVSVPGHQPHWRVNSPAPLPLGARCDVIIDPEMAFIFSSQ